MNTEKVLQDDNVSVDVAVILRKLPFLGKLLYKLEDPAMDVTVHSLDYEEILKPYRLPSIRTRCWLKFWRQFEDILVSMLRIPLIHTY
ncbi:hypothetical protein CDAR_26061 [Caerostris darwini]|uniref:Uncharacterized protein n=1 Tax=Caerostris darwini TaxID=1538125 RepID=A0AAV4MXK1_9ARAC|nr:hypothetical protein CDAR_26061 [Caerostris darwini]